MKQVVVLTEAANDLELGRDFYDAQQLGIGDYFVDSLLSDPLERLPKEASGSAGVVRSASAILGSQSRRYNSPSWK